MKQSGYIKQQGLYYISTHVLIKYKIILLNYTIWTKYAAVYWLEF